MTQCTSYPFGLQMPGRAYVQGSSTREDFTGHELDQETNLHYASVALGRQARRGTMTLMAHSRMETPVIIVLLSIVSYLLHVLVFRLINITHIEVNNITRQKHNKYKYIPLVIGIGLLILYAIDTLARFYL